MGMHRIQGRQTKAEKEKADTARTGLGSFVASETPFRGSLRALEAETELVSAQLVFNKSRFKNTCEAVIGTPDSGSSGRKDDNNDDGVCLNDPLGTHQPRQTDANLDFNVWKN